MATAFDRDAALLGAYTDQPARLPEALRALLQPHWGDEPVQLYALTDLNAEGHLCEHWLVLGPEHLALLDAEGGVCSFRRDALRKVEERRSLSAVSVAFLGEDDAVLGSIRYSLRQQRAVGGILFVLEQQLEGRRLELPEAGDAYYADAVAEPIRKTQSSVVTRKLSVLGRLLTYLKPYRVPVALGAVAAIAHMLLLLVPPLLTGQIIDEVLAPAERGDLDLDRGWALAWQLLGALAAVMVFREVFLWYRLRSLTVIGERVARDLRRELYDHYHKLSVKYFSAHPTGSLISRVGSDTDRIWDFIAFGLMDMIWGVLLILGLAAAFLIVDWQLGLILVGPIPVIFYLLYSMSRRMHGVFTRLWQRWGALTAVVSDTLPGIRVVKAFDQGDYEQRRFDARNRSFSDEAEVIHRIWTTRWPLIYLGVSAMTVLVWAFAIPRVLGQPGFSPLTVGQFTTFLLLIGLFYIPLEMFGVLARMISRSLSSAQRVFEVLDTEPDIPVAEDAVELKPVRGQIVFENVTFGYDPVRQILKGISFEVGAGEVIGLVGPSGAGKTTIINLIARFYDAGTGRITIDGHDLRDLALGTYRRQLGMVLQDPYLFHGSLLENIRYGMPEAAHAEVVAAARAANAHDFICKLPQGYDTVVGERGHTLSGGERQRISIARAVLHNPRILLLDEATSSVDTETERKIQEAIDHLVRGRTVIAIAHRLSTLNRADRLFVMKDGRLVETGTHAELLRNPDGVYTQLHATQQALHSNYAV